MKRIKQISVFIENRHGRLLEILNLLSSSSINIKALSLADSSDFGIARLIVKGTEEAVALLKSNHFTLSVTNIIACVVEDKPGSLARILKLLSDNEINIEYMYGFTSPIENKAVMVLRASDIDKAQKLLSDNKIEMLSQEEIREI